MEIAVDAHATRLLREISPPEACVDSSLGPYVTHALRESLVRGTFESRDSTRDLVELLESHCQISSAAARDVLSSIALAVKTGEVSDPARDPARSNLVPDDNVPTTRSRSKSVGAEPAFDVEFLGKILSETAFVRDEPKQDLSFSPLLGVGLSLSTPHISEVGVSSSFVLKRERNKPRSVTFDETSTWYSSPAPAFQSPTSLVTGGILEEQPDVFEPLEGILGALDLEGEDETPAPTIHGIPDNSSENENEREAKIDNPLRKANEQPSQLIQREAPPQSPELTETSSTIGIRQELISKHDSRKKHKPCQIEATDLAAALFRPSRPRSNSLADRRSQRPPQCEANDLAASLFRPSRPRSNSHMDQRQRPISPTSLLTTPPGLSSESSPTGGKEAVTLCGIIPDDSARSLQMAGVLSSDAITKDAAELKSTIQLLLTMNSHLGHEAASLAAQLTDGDLNLAQYLIEAARSDSSHPNYPRSRRSRLCRHELRGTCYRADCPYSHDFSGVTCLFWLKGRCRESNCRFMHGFAESLLEGICKEYLVEQKEKKKEEEERKRLHQQEMEEKNRIRTTNLLDHNQWSTDKFSSPSLASGSGSPPSLFGNGCWTSSSIANQ